MVEGVNGSIAVSAPAGEITGRCREPDCATAGLRHDPLSLAVPEDCASLTDRQAASLICPNPAPNEQCRNCSFPVLTSLVARILQDQHTAGRIADGELEAGVMDEITPENAKSLVANNGHWQPDKTAFRIVSFALTISGYDPGRLDNVKESIKKGFELAGESFGGKLPEMSGKTLAAVMDGLDAWAGNPDRRPPD